MNWFMSLFQKKNWGGKYRVVKKTLGNGDVKYKIEEKAYDVLGDSYWRPATSQEFTDFIEAALCVSGLYENYCQTRTVKTERIY